MYNCDETEEGFTIEELLSGDMFQERPELTWKKLRQIEEAYRGAKFDRGHSVIAEVEQHFPRVWTLTQNVDGFHHAAGVAQPHRHPRPAASGALHRLSLGGDR
jgi:NAD-dependent deacetylase